MALSEGFPCSDWYHFLCGLFGFLSLMAIGMSLGKRSWSTKACKRVTMKRAMTVNVAMRESTTAKA